MAVDQATQNGIFWLQALTAVLTFAGIVFSGIMAFLMARLKGQQELAAKAVIEVKNQFKETSSESIGQLVKLVDTSAKSHDLANSFMLEQKKQLMETAIELANATNKPEHKAKAEVAISAYKAHKVTDEQMKAAEMSADAERRSSQIVKTQVVETQVVKKVEE